VVQNVLGTLRGPRCHELVIRIAEQSATSDRHQGRVADVGKDHGDSLPALDRARRRGEVLDRQSVEPHGVKHLLDGGLVLSHIGTAQAGRHLHQLVM
jgi:hypothetical protein